MELHEVIKKANPTEWAENLLGELASYSYALAIEIHRLYAEVNNLKEEIARLRIAKES